jgi:hypothetical protein
VAHRKINRLPCGNVIVEFSVAELVKGEAVTAGIGFSVFANTV